MSEETAVYHTENQLPMQYSLESPSTMIHLAEDLTRFIREQKLTVKIQGKDFVTVEGWQFAGMSLGMVPVVQSVTNLSTENEVKYQCVVNLVQVKTGQVVGTGYAICSNREDNKKKFQEYAVLSMSQCVPLRAQILTADGFKFYNQLKIGDSVLSYDCSTDMSYWVPLEDITIFPIADVYKMENRSFRAYCTYNHTWPVQSRGHDRTTIYRKLKPLSNLKSGNIILSARAEGGTSPIQPIESYLMGWILTDGSISRRIHIDQSKQEYVVKIRETLMSLFGSVKESVTEPRVRTFPTGKTYLCKPSHRFQLNTKQTREILGRFGIVSKDDPSIFRAISSLSSTSRVSMLQSMLEADGHPIRQTSWRFGKKKDIVMNVFRMLCVLEGKALGKLTDDNGMPGQVVRSHQFACVSSLDISLSGREPVWCPTTRFGTWIMSIDGNVMITGNTRAISRAYRNALAWLIKAAGFEPTPAEEMEFDEKKPEPKPVVPTPLGSVSNDVISSMIDGLDATLVSAQIRKDYGLDPLHSQKKVSIMKYYETAHQKEFEAHLKTFGQLITVGDVLLMMSKIPDEKVHPTLVRYWTLDELELLIDSLKGPNETVDDIHF